MSLPQSLENHFFFLVDENTVTAIPKLLLGTTIGKKSSVGKSHKLYQKRYLYMSAVPTSMKLNRP